MDAEELDSAQVERRFPGLRMPAHWAALYNRDAGVLAASKAVGMLLALARARGATLRDRCGVVALEDGPGGAIRLRLAGEGADGAPEVLAKKVIFAAGPWMGPLLEDTLQVKLDLQPISLTVCYWRVKPGMEHLYAPQGPTTAQRDGFPVFINYGDDQTPPEARAPGDPSDPLLYGFPALDMGPGLVKANLHLPQSFWPEVPRDASGRPATTDMDVVRKVRQ